MVRVQRGQDRVAGPRGVTAIQATLDVARAGARKARAEAEALRDARAEGDGGCWRGSGRRCGGVTATPVC